MKLYLLERIGDVPRDETAGIVVRAKNATAARLLASREALGDESTIFKDAARSTCDRLHEDGESCAILMEFCGYTD